MDQTSHSPGKNKGHHSQRHPFLFLPIVCSSHLLMPRYSSDEGSHILTTDGRRGMVLAWLSAEQEKTTGTQERRGSVRTSTQQAAAWLVAAAKKAKFSPHAERTPQQRFDSFTHSSCTERTSFSFRFFSGIKVKKRVKKKEVHEQRNVNSAISMLHTPFSHASDLCYSITVLLQA